MKSFTLTKERKTRIWVNELPQIGRAESSACSKLVNCKGCFRPLNVSIAVELFIPAGARFYYGMLGIQSLGKIDRQSTIEIANFPRNQNDGIGGSLVDTLDTVVPWVDDEYHAAILTGASAAAVNYAELPTTIRVCSGKQGHIGSTSDMFRRLVDCNV